MTADGLGTPAAGQPRPTAGRRPLIAPATEPLARLTGSPFRQLHPVSAVLNNGRQLLATHGPRDEPAEESPAAAVVIWDVRHRRMIRTIAAPPSRSLALAARPEGGALVAALSDDGRLRVWDALTGRRLWRRRAGPGAGLALGSLPDGQEFAAVSVPFGVRLRAAQTGDTLRELGGLVQRVPAVACAALAGGPTLLAAASGARVQVWDAATGRPLHSLLGHAAPVAVLALHAGSDGGALLAAATRTEVRLWDALTGQLRHVLPCRRDPVRYPIGSAALAFSGTGLLAYSMLESYDVWLWDTETGAQLAGIGANRARTWGVTFVEPPEPGADTELAGEVAAAVTGDAAAAVADEAAAAGEVAAAVAGEVAGEVAAVAAASTGTAVRLWPLIRPRDGPEPGLTGLFAGAPAALATGPGSAGPLAFVSRSDRVVLAQADSGVVRLRHPASGEVLWELPAGAEVAALASLRARDGRALLGGVTPAAVLIWDPDSGDVLARHPWTAPARLPGLALIAGLEGPRLVLVTALDRLALWDVLTDRSIGQLTGRPRTPRSLAAAGSRLVSGTYDGAVQVWDLDAGACLRTMVPDVAPIRAVALTSLPDGSPLVVSGDEAGTVQAWHAETGTLLDARRDLGGPVGGLACHAEPGGRLLVAAAVGRGSYRVLQWESTSGSRPTPTTGT